MQPGAMMKKSRTVMFIFFILNLSLFSYNALASGTKGLSSGGGLSFQLSNYNGFNISCNGLSDGSIDLTPSGTAPFTFVWSTGASSEDLSGIPAGTYTVTVTDNFGVIETGSVTLIEPPVLTALIDSFQNVSCNGAANGIIYSNASGGVGPYSYLWSNGALTQTNSNLSAGFYTVTVTDQNGCTASLAQQITEPPLLTVSPNVIQNVLCNGQSTGAVSINISGGVPGYSFVWSNGALSQNITNVPAATYTVTVTDQNSCTAVTQATVSQPLQGLSATTSTTSPNCNASNGTATVNPAGGTPGYTYLWSDGSSNQTANGLGVGTYTVTVTDQNGCTFVTTAQVNPSVGPSISNAVVTNIACNGNTNGSIDITISGGTGTIVFLWSNGLTTEDLSGLSAGTYTVTVTDGSNCSVSGSYTINEPPPITITFSSNPPGCGSPNGSITANPSGGTPGYSYLWSNGQVTQTISNLPSGTYTVTVTDINNCTGSASFQLNPAAAPVITPVAVNNVTCNGLNNGSIDISVSGGVVPILYLWSNGALTQDISGLAPGTYTVTVTDLLLCSSTASYTINEPSAFSVTPAVTPALCGNSNGSASVNVSGDTPPYTYSWSNGGSSNAISSLAGGNYTVTVTGNTGCSTSQVLVVPSTSALAVTVDSVINANCISAASGAIYITASGSTGPFQYLWSDGSVNEDRTGLLAGTYTVTVTGSDGCTGTAAATVNPSASITLSFTTIDASCNQSNGSATAFPAGGNAPYSYLWSTGDFTQSITNISAGIYTVTVTDVAGCTGQNSVTINNSGAPSINLVNQTFPACNGTPDGSITVSASGGQPPYSYLWSTGDPTNSISNLSWGIYTVTVTDNFGCSAIASYDMGSDLQVALLNVQHVSCFGGSDGAVSIWVNGGATPYTFLWSNGANTQDLLNVPAGNYTLTVTDNAGCADSSVQVGISQGTAINILGFVVDVSCSTGGSVSTNVSGGTQPYNYLWSTGDVTSGISNVSAGIYTVTVTDALGCTAQNTFTVGSAAGISATFQVVQPVLCFGGSDGSLAVMASGGTPGYTYLWSTGSNSQMISGLAAGVYTVTITDVNNCQAVLQDTLTQPAPLSFTYTITDPSCNLSNGIIAVQANGGTTPYTYLWSNGTSASTLSNIAAGVYTLTITDANNCQKDTTFNISNTGSILINAAVDSVSCNGANDGSIDLTITGGALPYLFTWINTPQTTEDVFNLAAGNYSVIVTDQAGCTATQSFSVGGPTALIISFPLLQPAACGNANGAAIAAASGSYPPYTYLWSTGVTNPGLFNVAAGSYTVTVTDNRGCTASSVANISNNTGPVITVTDSGMVLCYGGNNGYVNVNVTGASPPFNYSWTGTSATTPNIANLTAGIYTLTVTDAQNCVSVRSVVITQPDSIIINPVISQNNPPYNLSCFGSNDGNILLSINGGFPPFTYLWSNGATTQNIQALPAGVYTVVVTDAQNCSATGMYTLTQPPQLVAIAGQDLTVCGTAIFTLQAQTPVYGIGFWTAITYPGVNIFSDSTSPNATVNNLQLGDNVFLWTVTDSKCSTATQVTITRASAIIASPGVDRSVCENNVTLNATTPQFGFGYWTSLTPGVTLEDSSQALTLAENLLPGNNIFLWTVVNGSCRDSAQVRIFRRDSLDCLANIKVPTAFSPNSDGFNDYFVVKGIEDFPENNLTVFNRWGIVVFETDNYRNDWDGTSADGTPLTDGTYFIVLKVRLLNDIYKSYLDLRR